MFRLTRAETEALNRSHFATGSQKHRDPRFPPFAFTEHGAIMAATILNSPTAVEMSLYVVRAFVRLRELDHLGEQLRILGIRRDRHRQLLDRRVLGRRRTWSSG